MAASKLPYRKNVEQLNQIVSDLEKNKSENNKKPNFNNNRKKKSCIGHNGNSTSDKDNLKCVIKSKDEQIDKLIEKLTILYNYNNQYAVDNEKLQKEVEILRDKFNELERADCDECKKYANELDSFQKENGDLVEDITMMKTLVYRLNVQVEHLQEILLKIHPSEKNFMRLDYSQPKVMNDDINWGTVNTHTLAPLLNSYQEFLNEKNDLIAQYEYELCTFTGNLKDIIEENNKLHDEIVTSKQAYESWNIEKTRMEAHLDIAMKKAALQTRRADVTKDKLFEIVKTYEKKNQAQILDMEQLRDTLTRTKTELLTLKNLQHQPEAIVENLKECQILFEKLKEHHDTETTKLKAELDEVKKLKTEDDGILLKVREENTELKSLISKQQQLNEILINKNTSIRQNFQRLRVSRENLKKRLKTAIAHTKTYEGGQEKIRNTWFELNQIQQLVDEKEIQIRKIQSKYQHEIESLQRKLKQREDTLKKVLQTKLNDKLQFK